MATKPTTIDEYLSAVTDAQRAALEKVRTAIRAAAPAAEEYIGYGLAAFRLDGKPLVAFGASPSHCAFYPMSSTTVAAFPEELAGYETSKGTIRFPATKPLPAALVKKLVRARIAENGGTTPTTKKATADTHSDPAVVEFLSELEHPLKPVIEAVRKLILGVDPAIREGVKWNAPSYRTTVDFATFNLRGGRVWLILHTGAKGKGAVSVPDPTGQVEWLAENRGVVKFADLADVRAKKAALTALLCEWIRQLPTT